MSRRAEYSVYIMTNKRNTVLYTGMTNDLGRRVVEHQTKADPESFTARYNVDKLVYVEVFDNPLDAIAREKQIKKGPRSKKVKLIESMNAKWRDLSEQLVLS